MTEDTGFSPEQPAPAPEPEAPPAPEPPPVQEEAPAPEEPSEAPEAAQDDALYVPENQAGWLADNFARIDARLRKLEGR